MLFLYLSESESIYVLLMKNQDKWRRGWERNVWRKRAWQRRQNRTKWAKEFGRKPRVTVWKLRIALLGTSVQLLFVSQRIQSHNIGKEPTGFSNMEANLGEGCWQWKSVRRGMKRDGEEREYPEQTTASLTVRGRSRKVAERQSNRCF